VVTGNNSMTQLETPAGVGGGSPRGQPAWRARYQPSKSFMTLAAQEISTLDFDFHTRFVVRRLK